MALVLYLFTSLFSFEEAYSRDDWKHWQDINLDCRDTRADLLIVNTLEAVTFSNDSECYVKSGKWLDPYSGQVFFSAKKMDVDHIVPLHFAHNAGGWKWSLDTKAYFANDLLNLRVVSRRLNRQKGSKAFYEWLPPASQYHCEYIKTWFLVLTKYSLSLNSNELIPLLLILNKCASKP